MFSVGVEQSRDNIYRIASQFNGSVGALRTDSAPRFGACACVDSRVHHTCITKYLVKPALRSKSGRTDAEPGLASLRSASLPDSNSVGCRTLLSGVEHSAHLHTLHTDIHRVSTHRYLFLYLRMCGVSLLLLRSDPCCLRLLYTCNHRRRQLTATHHRPPRYLDWYLLCCRLCVRMMHVLGETIGPAAAATIYQEQISTADSYAAAEGRYVHTYIDRYVVARQRFTRLPVLR